MAECKLCLPAFVCGLVFLSGCAGISRLPEIDFVGKSRAEVIRIFAQNPEKSHDGSINLMIPTTPHKPLLCNVNVYFKTADDALADERIQNASAIAGYRTVRFMAVPGGWDAYEVVFDKNDTVVSQKISSWFDGP